MTFRERPDLNAAILGWQFDLSDTHEMAVALAFRKLAQEKTRTHKLEDAASRALVEMSGTDVAYAKAHLAALSPDMRREQVQTLAVPAMGLKFDQQRKNMDGGRE